MSYPNDDLAVLFADQQSAPGVGYRQGIIRAWNQATAENTVEVDGVLFENLSILNTNEATQLSPGDVVGILTTGGAASSWAILGRLTIPGTPAAASALAAVFSRIVAARDDTTGTRTSGVYGDLTGAAVGPSVTVNISGSGRALAFWSAQWGRTGSYETYQESSVSVAVSGATTIAASPDWGLGFSLASIYTPGPFEASQIAGIFQAGMMHLFTGLNPGSNTFTLKYRNVENTDAVEFTTREIAVFAM